MVTQKIYLENKINIQDSHFDINNKNESPVPSIDDNSDSENEEKSNNNEETIETFKQIIPPKEIINNDKKTHRSKSSANILSVNDKTFTYVPPKRPRTRHQTVGNVKDLVKVRNDMLAKGNDSKHVSEDVSLISKYYIKQPYKM